MLIDSEHIKETITADICIIGAGAAGITLALELASSAKNICVLEAGQQGVTESSGDAYRGLVTLPDAWVIPDEQREHFREYLSTSRLRFLGGTTNHWEGFCRPMAPHDFTERAWIPGSGWPLKASALQADYDRACEILQISPFVKPAQLAAQGWINSAGVQTDIYHHSPPVRFGTAYRNVLANAANIRVLTGATVTALRSTRSLREVDEATVTTISGERFVVRARTFVLACGGIENARLLLLSNEQHPAGLGNSSDHVGRHFMDHFMVYAAGDMVIDRAVAIERYTRIADPALPLHDGWEATRKHAMSAVLTLDAKTQAHYKLNDMAWYVYPQSKLNHTPDAMTRDIAVMAHFLDGRNIDVYDLVANCESTPHPDSRVTLDNERDTFGCRRAKLDWHVHAHDIVSVMQSTRVLGARLGGSGVARVRAQTLQAGQAYPYIMPEGHHCGTTRMSTRSTDGVVNANCRLHDVDNVYVAGSSVFPSIGYANPTLTIVALAVRLARHLRQKLTV